MEILKVMFSFLEKWMLLIIIMCSFLYGLFYVFLKKVLEIYMINGNFIDFIYAIAISVIAAGVFYLFQVYIPARRKRKILKANFEKQYTDFKKDCISMFLSALGSSFNEDLLKKLLNTHYFHSYFKSHLTKDQEKWDGVLNSIDDDFLKELLLQFDILSSEIMFMLNNYDFDEEVFIFLKRFRKIMHLLKNTKVEHEEIKRISRFLWSLFAGWSYASGVHEDDIFKEMMKRI